MSTNKFISVTAAVMFLGLGQTAARAQCELAKLTASDPAEAAQFGISVSISGDVAVIGAWFDDEACPDDPGCYSGSAYVYRFDGTTWIEEAKLTASDAAAGDYFGHSVSISGNVAVIGAHAADEACPEDPGCDSGSAYIYRFDGTTWIEEANLTASDGAAHDLFGTSVSISGDVAVIGAWFDDDGEAESGSAYVFRFDGNGWIEEAKLTASDAAAQDLFGFAVSVSGDVAVIGAFGDADVCPDDPSCHSGSAYIYRFDGTTWIEEARLSASDAAYQDSFGYSVAVNSDVAVIGAWGDDDGGSQSGSAYIYQFDGATWVEVRKLNALDADSEDLFGLSVSLSGDTAVVGSRKDDGACPEDPTCNSGSAYVFRYNGVSWEQEEKFTASDAAQQDAFGHSVAVNGDVAVIGAWGDDAGGFNTGSAYVFALGGADCNENDVCDSRDLAEGTSQDCNDTGVPDECDIADGTSADDDGNGIPDECETIGACCDTNTWTCEDGTLEGDCQPPLVWTVGAPCTHVLCQDPEAIPAVSGWGMAVVILSLVVGILAVFDRRRTESATCG